MKVNLMVWQLTSECIVGEIFPTVSVCQGPIFIYLRRSHTQIKCHISFARPTLLWCKDLPKCEPWRPLGLIKGSLKRAGKAHWLFRERQMLCGWMSLNLLFWMNFRRSDQSIIAGSDSAVTERKCKVHCWKGCALLRLQRSPAEHC